MFFENILTLHVTSKTPQVDTSDQKGFIIISIVLMICLLVVIFAVNYKAKCNFFVFTEFRYGLLEKVLLMFYFFTAMDVYGLRFARFDMNSE